jgi:Dolichyl-phosphate-mannose-protein mannosyltransferase
VNAPVSPIESPQSHGGKPLWACFIERYSRCCLIFAIAIIVLSFNGIWRVGRDSALYRGLGESIAAGQGFMFAGEINHHAYPGLPWLLAGIHRLAGPTDWPPILLMSICAVGFLWVSYQLIAANYPKWMAAVVLLGLGTNEIVVQQSQEIMTDMPFALGVVLSLYAWDRVRNAVAARSRMSWIGLMSMGLLLAATMRPTFWVLALAFVLAGMLYFVWPGQEQSASRRQRLLGVGALGIVAIVVGVLVMVDPGSMLAGRYKVELFDQLSRWTTALPGGLHIVLNGDINAAFFAQTMTSPAFVFSGILVCGIVLVARQHPLWAFNVLILIGVTSVFTSEARYFLMVLPILWLGWVLLADGVTRRLRNDHRSIAMAVMILLPMGFNFAKSIGFIVEQRRCDLAMFSNDQTRRDLFYSYYRDGEIPLIRQLGQAIHDRAEPYDRILSPEANMVAYFARNRRVVGLHTRIALRVPEADWARTLADFDPTIVVFPGKLYRDSDPKVTTMMTKGIIRSKRTILRNKDVSGATLFTLDRPEMVVPAGDWRKHESTTR